MTLFYKSGGETKNPLPALDQNVIALVEQYGWLPSWVLGEDERWINRLLMVMEAKERARRK